jgi:hypothetical protein
MPAARRIGTFFLIVGIALVALYLISDMAGSPDLRFAGLGVLLGTVGLILRSRYRPEPPPPAGRFNLLKKNVKGGGKKAGQSSAGLSGSERGEENSQRSPGGDSSRGKR